MRRDYRKGSADRSRRPRLIMNVLPLLILSVTVSPGRHWFPPWNRRKPALRGRGFSMARKCLLPRDFVEIKVRNTRSHCVLNQCRQPRFDDLPGSFIGCRNQHSSPLRETRLSD